MTLKKTFLLRRGNPVAGLMKLWVVAWLGKSNEQTLSLNLQRKSCVDTPILSHVSWEFSAQAILAGLIVGFDRAMETSPRY